MTAKKALAQKKEKSRNVRAISDYVLPFLMITFLIVLLLNPEKTSVAVFSTLTRCAKSLIPALFPCAVFSSLIGALGGGDLLGKIFGAPVSFLFGVSKSSSAAIVIGMLCGFPIGAAYAGVLYKNGCISKREFEKVAALSSIPSPAFTVNVIGRTLFGSKSAGVALFACVILSSLISSLFFRSRDSELTAEHTHADTQKSIGKALNEALSSSALTMLRLCSCVVFFSALTSVIPNFFPKALKLFLSGALEFSQGCNIAFALYGAKSFPVCAAFLGWSGFGVHFQIMSVCGSDISYKKYYLISFMKSVLSFVMAFVVRIVFFDI